MKRSDQFVLGLVGLFAIGVAVASAQVITNPPIAVPIGCAYNTTPVTLTNGQAGWVQCNNAGSLNVAASFTPSGTQDVNLTQVLGAAPSATNPIWVSPATASTPWTVGGASATGAALSGNPVRVGLSDGTNAQNWLAGIALGDGVNGNNTGAVAGFVWNGTTWDRMPGTTAGVTVRNPTAANLNATVVGNGTFATQSAITAASGSFASGSQSIGITPTDRTITSASGSSQTVASALATRKSLTIVNTGNANCGVNPTGGTAAIGGAGTITLAPLGSYTPRVPTLSAVTAICTAGQPLYADES